MPNSSQIPTVGRTQATQTLYNNLVKDAVRLLAVAGANKTIASGAITVTPSAGESHYQVDTEGGAANDDLATINGGVTGDIIGLVSANSSRIISVISGTGNILLTSGAPINLDTVGAFLLRYNGTNWVPYGGGGSSDASNLTNKSGGNVVAGDVVVFDTTNNNAFTVTSYAQDIRVMGIVKSAILSNGIGPVYTGAGTVCTINCDAVAISRGQFIVSSGTSKLATAGSYFREAGVFAIALSSKGAGVGTVTAMLVDNFRQALIGTTGWAMGGAGPITTTQKFSMATEIWTTVAGATLPVVKSSSSGMGNTTIAAYCIQGFGAGLPTWDRYKIPYATEITSTITNSSLYRDRMRSGSNFSAKGYAPGGFNSAAQSTICKTVFSTDTESAGLTLSSARQYQGGISDGTYAYMAGGSSTTTDMLDNATETRSTPGGAALGVASDGYSFASFPASAGYRAFNNGGGTVYSRKLTFSTGIDANNANSPTGNIAYANYVTDGIAYAYFCTASVNQKLSSTTGAFSSLTNYSISYQGANASYAAL